MHFSAPSQNNRKALKTYILIAALAGPGNWHVPCTSKARSRAVESFPGNWKLQISGRQKGVRQVLNVQETYQGASPYEPHFVSDLPGSQHSGNRWLFQQELREVTNNATDQQDQRARRSDREEFERHQGR